MMEREEWLRDRPKPTPVPVAHITVRSNLPGDIPRGDPARGIIGPLDEDGNEAERLGQQVELGLGLHLALS